MFGENKIALIPLRGTILFEGGVSPSFLAKGKVCNSEEILKLLEETKKSKEVKALILEINSPGGTPYPSKEIAEYLKGFGKPTVAWVREFAASGAYWIASSCQKIVGDTLSTVGSVGVASFRPDFSRLMKRIGVDIEAFTTGIYKALGSPFKKTSHKEKEILKEELQIIYKMFLEEVKKNRNLNEAVVNEISSGRVYLGEEGKRLGLLDYLGGREKALSVAQELAKIRRYKLLDFGKKKRKKKSLLEKLIGSFT